jgi:hypothetical protein
MAQKYIQLDIAYHGDGDLYRFEEKRFKTVDEVREYIKNWEEDRIDVEVKPDTYNGGFYAEYYNADCSHCRAPNGCVKHLERLGISEPCPDEWLEYVGFKIFSVTEEDIEEIAL